MTNQKNSRFLLAAITTSFFLASTAYTMNNELIEKKEKFEDLCNEISFSQLLKCVSCGLYQEKKTDYSNELTEIIGSDGKKGLDFFKYYKESNNLLKIIFTNKTIESLAANYDLIKNTNVANKEQLETIKTFIEKQQKEL